MLLAVAACAPTPVAPTTIILVVVDALRPDYLGCYGCPRQTSPHVDALAEESVLFLRAYATAPWTVPSCASILTGEYPSRHGMVFRPDARVFRTLPERTVTLAQILSGQGYSTVAVSAQPWISERLGFARGFDRFRVVSNVADSASARRVTTAALSLLSEEKGKAFLYLHYVDTHIPYCAPRAFRAGIEPGPGRLAPISGSPPAIQVKLVHEVWKLGGPTADEIEYLRWLYDGCVRYVDSQIGSLIAGIRELGLWDGCLVLLVSDHGESFWEHDALLHGTNLFEEELRVPLILRLPAATSAAQRYMRSGARVGEVVSVVDLMPTLMDVVGGSVPPLRSWLRRLPLMPGEAYRCYAEAPLGLDRVAVLEQDRKLVHHVRLDSLELYDLRHDPLETRNAVELLPGDADRLRRYLDEWQVAAPIPLEGPAVAQPSCEMTEQLQAMGYLQ